MNSWFTQRRLVTLALSVNVIVLAVVLVSGPSVRQILVLIGIMSALGVLALQKDEPRDRFESSGQTYRRPNARVKAILASVISLGLTILCFVWASRTKGGEAIVPALLGLPWLYVGTYGLWKALKS